MCGLIGYIPSPTTKVSADKRVRSLLRESSIRGSEATGVALFFRKSYQIIKLPVSGPLFLRSSLYQQVKQKVTTSNCVIGHARLATHGASKTPHNNQPIEYRGIVCVHNGIIINVASLFSSIGKVPKTDLDSEIIPKHIFWQLSKKQTMIQAIQQTMEKIIGETSILIKDTTDMLYGATNTGSLYIAKNDQEILVASERRILDHLVSSSTHTTMHVAPNTGVAIHIHTRTISQFSFRRCSTITATRPLQKLRFNYCDGMYKNSLQKLQKHVPNTAVIQKIRRCTKCILPETMPFISFDAQGVCNYCRSYIKQHQKGKGALVRVFQDAQGKTQRSRDGYQCIVPLSGGRDSSFGLHYVVKELHLKPIAYTYDWGMVTDVARRNQSRMTSLLGVEHVIVSANIQYKLRNIRKNLEAWLAKPDIVMVPLLMAGDKQAEYYAEQLHRDTKIQHILYCRGNQLEDEFFKFGHFGIYNGTPRGVLHDLSTLGKLQMASYFIQACIRNPRYINSSLIDTAFAAFSAYGMNYHFHYLWHYVPWNEKEVLSTLATYGWEGAQDTISTWRIDDGTPPLYNYIYYHLQGFTEHDALRSNQIREGHITRTHALALITRENAPRYESLQWYFDRIGMDGDKVLSTIDAMPTLF